MTPPSASPPLLAPAGPGPVTRVPAGPAIVAVAVLVTTLTVATAVLAAWALGAGTPGLLGRDGPPWWLAPALRAGRDVAGASALGLLLLTAGAVSAPGGAGSASAPAWTPAHPGVRLAAGAAAVAAATGAAHVVVAGAALTGRPLGAGGAGSDLLVLMGAVGGYRMLAYSALTMLVVAAVAARAQRRQTLLRLAAAAALATALLGGSGHAVGHGAAVGALAVHVLAASAWCGGLGALLVLRVVAGDDVASLLPRFSRLAGLCFAAVALSGVVAVLLRWHGGDPGPVWSGLAAVKVALLLALAAAGRRQRRRVVGRARAGRPVPWSDLVRIGLVELTLMGVATGAGVALSAAG
ncbi:CopD family protein [Aquipuribacter sp. MA13-6]|uniref:CopD family protein n=1 Tax=unclassified Aquipuribacter TaxID=2635084 RepID=UPI003EE9B1CF